MNSVKELESTIGTRRQISLAWLVGLVVVLIFSAAGFVLTGWQWSPSFQAFVETVAASLALFAGIISLVRHRTHGDRTFLFIGVGFVGAALLDGFDAMRIAAEFVPATEGVNGGMDAASDWCWLSSRLLLSTCLFLSLRTDSPPKQRRLFDRTILLVTGVLSITLLAAITWFDLPPLANGNWWIPRPGELIPAILFALALRGYLRKRHWQRDAFESLLVCSLVMAILIQLIVAMTASRFSPSFNMAICLQVGSYVLVVIGSTVSISDTFAEVQRLNQVQERNVLALARVNEGLEAFVRSASHDLKAPLRHIYGFASFVRDDASDRLTDSERGDLQRVMDAANHMSALLESLLRFAKLGATSLQRETFQLSEIMEVVLAQLPSQQRECVEYSGECVLSGDRALLTLVLQNLVENGLKYVEQRTPHVVVSGRTTDNGWEIAVCDNGIGVREEHLGEIFRAGFRGVNDANISGMGFGLATCARIIDAHQGRIWVTSNPEVGSTFTFTLPRSAEQANAE